MNRFSINSYAEAESRIRAGGLYDLGQICPKVLSQLSWARNLGQIVETVDSYPIRGCGNNERILWIAGSKAEN